jgi:hypothetical protein
LEVAWREIARITVVQELLLAYEGIEDFALALTLCVCPCVERRAGACVMRVR